MADAKLSRNAIIQKRDAKKRAFPYPPELQFGGMARPPPPYYAPPNYNSSQQPLYPPLQSFPRQNQPQSRPPYYGSYTKTKYTR